MHVVEGKSERRSPLRFARIGFFAMKAMEQKTFDGVETSPNRQLSIW